MTTKIEAIKAKLEVALAEEHEYTAPLHKEAILFIEAYVIVAARKAAGLGNLTYPKLKAGTTHVDKRAILAAVLHGAEIGELDLGKFHGKEFDEAKAIIAYKKKHAA
jgi:hypothetical protein|tara:strand:+ start:940 stop:1260 length:321 start_codon:yes stop_codon:yes gene_type:complete